MKRTAYLTIDDAPRKDFRVKLEFLKSMDIPAVFYCTGMELEKNFEDAVWALREGYVIGNHSYSHIHFSTLSLDQACAEILRTDSIIEKIYKDAERKMIRTFRFPYGDKGWGDDPLDSFATGRQSFLYKGIQNFLYELGYRQPCFPGLVNDSFDRCGLLNDIDVYWTYDCQEWKYDGSDEIRGKIFRRIDIDDPENWFGLNSGNSAEIILIHDHDETSHIFESLVKKIAEKGFVFKLPVFCA